MNLFAHRSTVSFLRFYSKFLAVCLRLLNLKVTPIIMTMSTYRIICYNMLSSLKRVYDFATRWKCTLYMLHTQVVHACAAAIRYFFYTQSHTQHTKVYSLHTHLQDPRTCNLKIAYFELHKNCYLRRRHRSP